MHQVFQAGLIYHSSNMLKFYEKREILQILRHYLYILPLQIFFTRVWELSYFYMLCTNLSPMLASAL